MGVGHGPPPSLRGRSPAVGPPHGINPVSGKISLPRRRPCGVRFGDVGSPPRNPARRVACRRPPVPGKGAPGTRWWWWRSQPSWPSKTCLGADLYLVSRREVYRSCPQVPCCGPWLANRPAEMGVNWLTIRLTWLARLEEDGQGGRRRSGGIRAHLRTVDMNEFPLRDHDSTWTLATAGA